MINPNDLREILFNISKNIILPSFGNLKKNQVSYKEGRDIVTDIERYYDNTRNKIQKAFDSMGEVRNEEGLKVGGFLSPAVESAFNKDLRPVVKQGFTKGLEQPKVKVLSQADLDAARMGGPVAEAEPKPAPPTPCLIMYSPVP